jgi:hypothetical protein
MINFDVQMTIYLAWAVRIALLVFYIPLGILSSMIQSAHRLDLWASAIVMQSAVHLQDCRSERTLEDRRFLFQRQTWRGESPTASRFRLELREL